MSDTPDDFDDNSLLKLADKWHKSGNLDAAKQTYEQLISRHPDVPDLFINLAVVYRSQQRFTKSAEMLRRAIELAPDHAGAHYNLANIQVDLKRPKAAEISYLKCLSLAPRFLDASINFGELLLANDRHTEAKRVLSDAIERHPKEPRLHNNLGNMYKQAGQLAEAEAHLRQATTYAPKNGDYHRHLGAIVLAQGNHKASVDILSTAIELAPEDADAYCLRAFSRLSLGDFKAGWKDYAWRWKSKEQELPRPFRQALWTGVPLVGKSLLIWGEQGVGDEIMYSSILPDVLKDTSRIILECEPRLAPLFARSFPEIEVVERQKTPAASLQSSSIDFQVPIAGLAQYYRSGVQEFGKPAAFLISDTNLRNDIRNRYQQLANGRRLVGVSWKSGAGRTGAGRSLTLSDLTPLFDLCDAFFVNLQYGDVDSEQAQLKKDHDVELYQDRSINQMLDMNTYAAQIAALDMVLSAANTTVHVAGGLGVPTEVLIPGVADWRWMTDREDTLWYSSVRLHRKSEDQTIRHYLMAVSDCIGSEFDE